MTSRWNAWATRCALSMLAKREPSRTCAHTRCRRRHGEGEEASRTSARAVVVVVWCAQGWGEMRLRNRKGLGRGVDGVGAGGARMGAGTGRLAVGRQVEGSVRIVRLALALPLASVTRRAADRRTNLLAEDLHLHAVAQRPARVALSRAGGQGMAGRGA